MIEQAKHLLLVKNEGNLLQDFIWQTQQIGGGNAALPGAPIDKDTAKQHGNQALEGLRTLGTLIISNGQFRKLRKFEHLRFRLEIRAVTDNSTVNDATVLLRDMAGDAAQTAANKVNPSQEQLANIDRPADDNTWHDTPDSSDFKNQARSKMDKYKPFSRADVKDVAGDASQSATGKRDPNEAASSGMSDAQHGNQPDVDAAGGARSGYQNLANKAQENFPTEEVKDRARNTKENVRNQSKDYYNKKMPQERREQTIWRLKKMVTEIQGHPDCMLTEVWSRLGT